MKHTIQNISGRPLTIICNSGKALHMSPNISYELSDTEFKENAMIEKLSKKKFVREISIKTVEKSATKVEDKPGTKQVSATKAKSTKK